MQTPHPTHPYIMLYTILDCINTIKLTLVFCIKMIDINFNDTFYDDINNHILTQN